MYLREGLYSLVNPQIGTNRNGGQYLKCLLRDAGGEVAGRKWKLDDFDLADCTSTGFVRLDGEVVEFNGLPQVNIHDIEPAQVTESELALLLPHSRFDIDMMFTADYEQGFVYEFALAEDGSIGDTTELISVQEPRCIAYFYGLDKSEGKVSGSGAGQASIAHDTEASAISPESAAPAVKRSAKVANLAAAKKVVDESATSAHSLPSTAAMAVVGLFTAGIVGAAVSFRPAACL